FAGEGVAVEADGGGVTLLVGLLTQVGQRQLLGSVLGLTVALEDGRQTGIKSQQTFTGQELSGHVLEQRMSWGQQTAGALGGGLRLGEPAGLEQRQPQSTVDVGVVGVEFKSLVVMRDGPAQILLVVQGNAEVELDPGQFGVEFKSLVVVGDGP